MVKKSTTSKDELFDDSGDAANDEVLESGEVHKQEMTHSKSTKGTEVYATDDEDAWCSTVYIKKGRLPKKPPKKIVLAIKF